jgi:large subunit ribosomal protein L35
MKQKTHSGAKKRLRLKSSGKVKRKKCGMRHLLSHKSSKRKRLLGKMTYVDPANAYQIQRQLAI